MQPHASELEEAIIGACLIEQEALPLVADKLRPEMFYDDHHQLIFAALISGKQKDRYSHRQRRAHPSRSARKDRRAVYHRTTKQPGSFLRPHRVSRANRPPEIPGTRSRSRLQQTPHLRHG